MIDRPNVLTRRGMLTLLGSASLGFMPSWVRAETQPDHRFVLVILRGGLDGLAAVAPWRDKDYAALRGELAFDPPDGATGLRDLDGFFGLHPSLAELLPLWHRGEMLAIHAVASPYRERSHFDAQDILENGGNAVRAIQTGWLNRALAAMGARYQPGSALAIGTGIPLSMTGSAHVSSWSPNQFIPPANPDFLGRVAALWQHDPLLGAMLAEGISMQARSDELLSGNTMAGVRRPPANAGAFAALASAAGRLMAPADGPRIAVLEAGGWDTHAQQGKLSGRLAGNLEQFAKGINGMAQGLGAAWQHTIVVAVSEFGRTAAPNGTAGTDHGTGGVAFVFGGRVKGGRVAGDWPSLAPAQLHEGRDLRPTTDIRAVFKSVLRDHLGVDRAAIDSSVFPDSQSIAAIQGLIHT